MGNLIEKIKQNKKSIIIVIIIILLIVAGFLSGSGKLGGKSSAGDLSVKLLEDEGSLLANIEENNLNSEEPVYFTTIKVPVFADPDMFDYDGEMSSCADEIVWAKFTIEPTQTPLNATFQKMFAMGNELGFHPGNIIAEQNNLFFEKAVIQNAVANIYLSGSLSEDTFCKTNRSIIQIIEAATQFDTVNVVQIFLNNEIVG